MPYSPSHVTLSSLDRYVITDTNMEITAFKAAPGRRGRGGSAERGVPLIHVGR
jgi:hypothetical protein